MPAKRKLTMRQLRQVLRLPRDGVSVRDIAERLGIARSIVQENLTAAGRLHHNVLAAALANKLARIAWSVLSRNRTYEPRTAGVAG